MAYIVMVLGYLAILLYQIDLRQYVHMRALKLHLAESFDSHSHWGTAISIYGL